MPTHMGMASPEGVAAVEPTPIWNRNEVRRALQGMVAFAALGWGIQGLPDSFSEVVGPVFVFLAYAAAGGLILRGAARLEGRERLAWTLVGAGLALASLGVLVFAVVILFVPDLPTFSPVDILFLVGYVVTIIGFFTLPHIRAHRSHRLRLLLDALVGGAALGTLLWAEVVNPLLAGLPDVGPEQTIVASAYPILDLVLLVTVMIVVVRRSALRFDVRLILVAATMSLQAVSDLQFLTNGLGSSFRDVQPPYGILGMAAGTLIAAGFLIEYRPAPREYVERRPSLVPMVVPYLVTGVLVVVLIRTMADSGTTATGFHLLIGFLATVALVVVRQAVAIHENRELVESQRRALVSSVSHELRTPLAAVVGFLDLLTDDPGNLGPDETKELIAMADEQAHHMARIVEDLILLARGDLRDIELNETLIDPADLVNDAVVTLDAPGVAYVDETGGWLVHGDPDRLRQSVINLVSNAVRYGGPTRQMVFRREGDVAFLEMHDDGPGVPRRYELTIWERFERGANRFNATVPGSGIGLAVVEAMAAAHGGKATYRRSERLGGACFEIVLPGRAVPGPAGEVATETPAAVNL